MEALDPSAVLHYETGLICTERRNFAEGTKGPRSEQSHCVVFPSHSFISIEFVLFMYLKV